MMITSADIATPLELPRAPTSICGRGARSSTSATTSNQCVLIRVSGQVGTSSDLMAGNQAGVTRGTASNAWSRTVRRATPPPPSARGPPTTKAAVYRTPLCPYRSLYDCGGRHTLLTCQGHYRRSQGTKCYWSRETPLAAPIDCTISWSGPAQTGSLEFGRMLTLVSACMPSLCTGLHADHYKEA
jgi:hypothetical protein